MAIANSSLAVRKVKSKIYRSMVSFDCSIWISFINDRFATPILWYKLFKSSCCYLYVEVYFVVHGDGDSDCD